MVDAKVLKSRSKLSVPCGSDGEESACNVRAPGSIPGLGKSHGWRSLTGYSLWDHKKLDGTQATNSFFLLSRRQPCLHSLRIGMNL